MTHSVFVVNYNISHGVIALNLTIYIDILFLINLTIDYIILNSTALISGNKAIKWRILTAASIGAIYSVIIFFPALEILNLILLKLAFSTIILLVAFKYKSISSLLKTTLIYYIINTVYGGGMYAFYHFTTLGSKMNYSNGIYYIDLPLWAIILLSFVFYFLIKLFTKITNERSIQKNISKLRIYFENTYIDINALLDTGNSLYDPISLMPVMLVESCQFRNKISDSFIREAESGKAGALPELHTAYPNLKLRVIPFHDVTGVKKVIYAFKPTKIINTETNKEINHMLVGIINSKLTNDNSYTALLHAVT